MKAIIILFLCVALLGAAGYFGYDIFVKPAKLEREYREAAPAASELHPGSAAAYAASNIRSASTGAPGRRNWNEQNTMNG